MSSPAPSLGSLRPSRGPALLLTGAAMIAFAANSLLARAALAGHATDPVRFTAIRLLSGAVLLGGLLAVRSAARRERRPANLLLATPGTWASALALFGYALAFSLAYDRVGAAAGALILFASVQGTMIGVALKRGERPSGRELAGLLVALVAFVILLLPGLDRPDVIGSMLMVASGACWGLYSLRGRGSRDAEGDTAGNFLRAALLALPLLALPLLAAPLYAMLPFTLPAEQGGAMPFDGEGTLLACLSGAITSGLGYVIWYRALPFLTATQAAVVQLSVPVIAALGAVAILGETLTLRLALCGSLILGGVAWTIRVKGR